MTLTFEAMTLNTPSVYPPLIERNNVQFGEDPCNPLRDIVHTKFLYMTLISNPMTLSMFPVQLP